MSKVVQHTIRSLYLAGSWSGLSGTNGFGVSVFGLPELNAVQALAASILVMAAIYAGLR